MGLMSAPAPFQPPADEDWGAGMWDLGGRDLGGPSA